MDFKKNHNLTFSIVLVETKNASHPGWFHRAGKMRIQRNGQNDQGPQHSVIQSFGRAIDQASGAETQAPFCSRMTILQKVSVVKSLGISAALSGVLMRSAGTSVR